MSSDAKKKGVSMGEFTPIFSIIFGILGYFVYGGIDGFFAVFAYSFLIGLFALIGLIPIFGPIIYLPLTFFWFNPAWMELTGIWWSWLLLLIYVIGFIESLAYTAVATIVVAD